MQGLGTQEDPYIVMNCDDFYNMRKGFCYYKLGADIDFAKSDHKPNADGIPLNGNLDGDSHTVSNFFVSSNSSGTDNFFLYNTTGKTISIINTNFKGIYLSGGNTGFTRSKTIGGITVRFKNCRFSIKINDTSNSPKPLFEYTYMEDCEFLIEGTTDYTKTIIRGDIIRSLLKLNMTAFIAKGSQILFIGNISNSGIIGNISGTHDLVYILTNSTILNSYFALDLNKVVTLSFDGTFSGINFYDKERLNANLMPPTSDNFHALTTEQCKSAEYLQSIGFPCTVEETI